MSESSAVGSRAHIALSERLQTMTEALAATAVSHDIFKIALNPLLEAVEALSGAIFLVDATSDHLEIAAIEGHSGEEATLWQAGPIDRCTPVTDALRQHAPLYFENAGVLTGTYPGLEAQTGSVTVVSMAVLPMFLDGKPLGALVLNFKEARSFALQEKRFLETLAAQCAVALRRGRVLDALERRAEERAVALESFVDFTETVGTESDVLRVAQHAVRLLGLRFPGCSNGYYILDDNLWKLRVHTDDLYDTPDFLDSLRAGVPFDTPIFVAALSSKEVVFVDGWDAEREQVEGANMYGTVALYPLIEDGAVRAMYALGLKNQARWLDRDRAIFRAVGQSLNLALGRAAQGQRLAAQSLELEARTQALEGFAQLSRELTTQDNPLLLVKKAQEVVRSLIPNGAAVYSELQDDVWQLRSQDGKVHHSELQQVLDAGIPKEASRGLVLPYLTRQPCYEEAQDHNMDTLHERVRHIGASASLPLLVGGKVRGIFALLLFERRRWSAADKAVLETVVRNLGIAVERALALQALNRSQHYLKVAADHAPILLFATDAQGVFTLSEGSLLKKLGLEPGQAVGRSATEMFSHESDLRDGHRLQRAFRGEATHDLTRFDSKGVVLETWFVPARDRAGDVTEVVGISIDATERLKVQQQIEEANRDLQRSNTELQAANEELEAFTYSASHDLRTPVRHVMGFAELALMAMVDAPNEKAQQHLEVVKRAALRMTALIDGMLVLSRSGRQHLKAELVDLSALVTQAQADVRQEFLGHPVMWDIAVLPQVMGDQDMLQQVMTNLLSNAVKYSAKRAQSEVKVWSEESASAWTINVQDNGVGFDAEYAQKLFGIFQRLHNEREFQGTGVGLATVRRIVLKHGGQVFAESRAQSGATFSFTLPKER